MGSQHYVVLPRLLPTKIKVLLIPKARIFKEVGLDTVVRDGEVLLELFFIFLISESVRKTTFLKILFIYF